MFSAINLLIPSVNRNTLKLISNPTREFVSFK